MKNSLLVLFLVITFNYQMMAQANSTPIPLVAGPDQESVTVRGDLADGIFIKDLSWAWNSSVACFPEIQAEKFTGKHVLYQIDLPSYTSMVITVTPDDVKANFSLYAYEAGKITPDNTVPNLTRCVRCEADHFSERPRKGKPQDHTRWVDDIVAIRNPYQVLIGVVGAEGLAEGGFQLDIKIAPYRRPER